VFEHDWRNPVVAALSIVDSLFEGVKVLKSHELFDIVVKQKVLSEGLQSIN
jgi:hypothetical protein